MKYVAVTMAYNEECYIEDTIKSVLGQTIPPDLYLIINDGSTDKTQEILEKYPVTSIIIDEPRYFLPTANMYRAITRGIDKVTQLVPDWDFLVKVDSDSRISENYVADLICNMQKQPNLGISSGVMKGGKVWQGRASDGAKVYRRECWDDIGGLDPITHWDTHAILKAYQKGWVVTSFQNLTYDEVRTHEREALREWYLTGATRYYLGFPLYHTIGIGVVYCKKKPYFIGSLTMILTQLFYTLLRKKRVFDKDYYDFAKDYAYHETRARMKIILNTLLGRQKLKDFR